MRRAVVSLFLAIVVFGTAWGQEPEEKPVSAVIELNQRVYYAGDPFNVRISIGNNTNEEIGNPIKTPLSKGFEVRVADGDRVAAEGEPKLPEPQRPAKLGPRGFYGSVVDLTTAYPRLLSTGIYEIEWSANGVSSNTLRVKIIPRYEPTASYRAVMETDHGGIVIELFGDVSPLAVKNFVDLAHASFYDGLTFHEVRPDRYIASGDPTGTGGGGAGYTFPAETSGAPVMAGSVLMKPAGPTPPSNSSQFLIVLRPEPAWVGQLTVVGQVVGGLDTVRKISRAQTVPGASRPSLKPLNDVKIKSVTIQKKTGDGS